LPHIIIYYILTILQAVVRYCNSSREQCTKINFNMWRFIIIGSVGRALKEFEEINLEHW
jgi:hypothetical protein